MYIGKVFITTACFEGFMNLSLCHCALRTNSADDDIFHFFFFFQKIDFVFPC